MKIFYNSKTLKIMGSSDDENSMNFPFIETDISYHSFENLAIERKKGIPKIKVIKGIMGKNDCENHHKVNEDTKAYTRKYMKEQLKHLIK